MPLWLCVCAYTCVACKMDGWCITCCVQGSLKFQVLKLNKVDNMAGLLALPLRCCATTMHLIHNRAPRFLELLILHLLLEMRGNSSRENLSTLRKLSGFGKHHCRLAIAHAMAIAHLSLVGLEKFRRLPRSGPGAPAHDAQMTRQQHQHCEQMQRFRAPSPHREHLVSRHLCTDSSCSPSRAPAASTMVLPVGPCHRLA